MNAGDAMDRARRQWTESVFADQIARVAAQLRWRRSHTPTVTQKARGGRTIIVTPAGRGFPDEHLVRSGWSIHVELKAERGNPTDDQVDWLTQWAGWSPDDGWRSRGDEPTHRIEGRRYVGLWRPRHWTHITRILDLDRDVWTP